MHVMHIMPLLKQNHLEHFWILLFNYKKTFFVPWGDHMNKPIRLLMITLLSIFLLSLLITNGYINKKINDYAITSTEKMFGHARLQPNQEKFITTLAAEMGITKPFLIRKGNTGALQSHGYYNAFVYFPALFNIIPISSTPFLCISEGFFEDLSPQEQRFLIGHELIHIQEGHTHYYMLAIISLLLFLFIVWWVCITKYVYRLAAYLPPFYQRAGIFLGSGFTLTACFIIHAIICNAYRRHIEWEADKTSVALLNSHQGGIQFIDRLQKEFGQASHNPYYDLLADHPSLYDRKAYFLAHKNN